MKHIISACQWLLANGGIAALITGLHSRRGLSRTHSEAKTISSDISKYKPSFFIRG